jgi:hypothetical protein
MCEAGAISKEVRRESSTRKSRNSITCFTRYKSTNTDATSAESSSYFLFRNFLLRNHSRGEMVKISRPFSGREQEHREEKHVFSSKRVLSKNERTSEPIKWCLTRLFLLRSSGLLCLDLETKG